MFKYLSSLVSEYTPDPVDIFTYEINPYASRIFELAKSIKGMSDYTIHRESNDMLLNFASALLINFYKRFTDNYHKEVVDDFTAKLSANRFYGKTLGEFDSSGAESATDINQSLGFKLDDLVYKTSEVFNDPRHLKLYYSVVSSLHEQFRDGKEIAATVSDSEYKQWGDIFGLLSQSLGHALKRIDEIKASPALSVNNIYAGFLIRELKKKTPYQTYVSEHNPYFEQAVEYFKKAKISVTAETSNSMAILYAGSFLRLFSYRVCELICDLIKGNYDVKETLSRIRSNNFVNEIFLLTAKEPEESKARESFQNPSVLNPLKESLTRFLDELRKGDLVEFIGEEKQADFVNGLSSMILALTHAQIRANEIRLSAYINNGAGSSQSK